MNFLDRLLMVIYSLGTLVILLLLGLVAAGWSTPVNYLQVYVLDYGHRVVIGLFLLVFAFISLKFLVQALSSAKAPVQAVIQQTDMGQVRISVEAMQNMVHKVVAPLRGVKNVRPRVSCCPEGINVFIKLEVTPDISVPDITLETQNTVQSYIKEYVGVPVNTIRILVDDVAQDSKTTSGRSLN